MWSLVLGVAALAAGADAAVSPGWKPPAWNRRPTAEQIHAVWPRKALTEGLGGKVLLDCRVNVHGVVEDCKVKSEDPPDQGFGAAALVLTPEFLFSPATTAAGPVPARVVIPINFKNDGRPLPPQTLVNSLTMIGHPEWSAAPTFADIAAAYPKGADGAPGYAVFRCEVRKTGELHDCELSREEPKGKGFERAARGLIPKFRMTVAPAALAEHKPIYVNLPIRLVRPDDPDLVAHHFAEPMWTRTIAQDQVQALYPPEAAAKGVTTGLGFAECAIAADGTLTDCHTLPGKPDGLGFSEAAVRVAKVMQMSLWTQEGGPVVGGSVKLPVRFIMSEPTPPATPPK